MSINRFVSTISSAAEAIKAAEEGGADSGKKGSFLDDVKQIWNSDKIIPDMEEQLISQEEEIEKLKKQINRLLNNQRKLKRQLKEQEVESAKVVQSKTAAGADSRTIAAASGIDLNLDASKARDALVLSEIIGQPISKRRARRSVH